ncbi:MAG TPA: 2-phosphosulfolactate phosphatase [Bacteroidia bacterium]|jgi:2-phosphosulfolactate phosphatase|nr:2-phosphosulfolactate phosphatase [Bacteroidia bacterium]
MSDSPEIKVDACFSPYLYPVYEDKESIVVIIDVLRATSAICTAFHYGAEKIIPVAKVEEAKALKDKGMLAGAERNAVKVEGFDFGNSPFDYMGENIKGATIALTTTNGTQAIEASKNAYMVVVGAFTNISALADWLTAQKRNVLLLCSGWKNKFNLEDSLFAGAMTVELVKRNPDLKLGDACLALQHLYKLADKDQRMFLARASHKERLHKLNLKDDIRYCLQPDLTDVIPVLRDGALVKM